MNAKVETESGRLDSLKLGVAVLILGGGIYAFYHFEEQLLVLRVLALLAVAGISIFIAAQSAMGKSILGFISGAQREVRRVVWPSRAETMQTTLAVVLMVLLVPMITMRVFAEERSRGTDELRVEIARYSSTAIEDVVRSTIDDAAHEVEKEDLRLAGGYPCP